MLSEAWIGLHAASTPLISAGPLRLATGWIAGLGIGMVAALLGVAGGELLIPTIVPSMVWTSDWRAVCR